MKRNLEILLVLASFLAVAVSCTEHKAPGETSKDDNGNVIYKGGDPNCYEFSMNAAEGDFVASENGVTIKVDQIQDNNVVFSLLPGASVASYRVDVYPKAILYNALLEQGVVGAETDVVEEEIIGLLTSLGGAAGYIFSSENENMVDYANHQFDWMNSNYAQYKLVPDCEYFIIVAGCYDTEGQNVASLSISHFTTTSQALTGNPQIEIDVQIGYRAYQINFHPNSDCKYFYDWNYVTEEIDEYIDLFGDKMMRDFMRCAVTAARNASNLEDLTSRVNFDSPDSDQSYTAVAIALDVNQMPASEIARYDFSLKAAPEDASLPKVEMSVNKDRIGATVVWIQGTLDKNCMSAYYNVISKSKGDALMADENLSNSYAYILASEDGYGVANQNFTFNPETEQPTGSSYAFNTATEYVPDLAPNTEYVVAYVGKNYFGQLSELHISESFTTDAIVLDKPEDCICNDDFVFEMLNPSREGWIFHTQAEWNDMASYRWTIASPQPYSSIDCPYVDDNNTGSREDWMDFLYGMDIKGVPNCMIWFPTPSGVDNFTSFGYESGLEYVIAYCAEDLNGVVGPVKFTKVTTTVVKPGPNPTMEIKATVSPDGKTISCEFISNEDSKQLKYYGSSEGSYQNLGLHKLLNDLREEYEYSDFLRIWTNYAVELGIQSGNTSATATYEIEDPEQFLLIGAIAIGENNGEDCYSPFAYKLYYKGEFHTLEEYREAPKN